ncbi:Sodium/calcium exchanger protein-domain-containing protein [Epithele typhae]|uniref:Sodium/calcium exchanger protein-domain-containing protein n=1 Tax=Epithele typhae TaxID=378194 RepID=UPI0020082DB5|nr:Sodium/calcium exchanger protein-domain-containing protein [Epithele typhae]KAH9945377.1 Sodium/calcium exchanger protein-domain-containing protein [Epithele typhae]
MPTPGSADRHPIPTSSPSSSSHSSADTPPRPLPPPVSMSRSSTRNSAVSYASSSPFIQLPTPDPPRRSIMQSLFNGWRNRSTQHSPAGLFPQQHSNRSSVHKFPNAPKPSVGITHGWRAIVFDSWFNLLLLFLPVAGILKLASPDSGTLIFSACLLAMIPLVKLHDLATGVLSRRIGGSKTGLLNASLVSPVIALWKCELRVVQSMLVGAMLSKLLLILGMCFFAGGLKFSEQGFDSTTTQIHSSLLNISVGAVLLPAAFHFALTYGKSGDGDSITLQQQKDDILRMSHGVAIVLLFIYASYLVFQLWSHNHLYTDRHHQPSDKLQAAETVRTATQRVREKGSDLYDRAVSPSLERLRSNSGSRATFRPLTGKGTSQKSYPPCRSQSRIDTLVEEPEMSQNSETPRPGSSPYLHSSAAATGSNFNSRTALLSSPLGTTSQLTLANPIAKPQQSVRLVTDAQAFRITTSNLDSGSGSEPSSPDRYSPVSGLGNGSSSESEAERRKPGIGKRPRSRSRTPISDVLSAYYYGGEPVEMHERAQTHYRDTRLSTLSDATIGEPWQSSPMCSSPPEQVELSWTMTIVMLTIVTILVAVNAEWMVDAMDNVSPSLDKEWIGLVLLPTVSAIAECVTAVNVSVRDQLTLSISVAVGSTIQTALFVIPVMVILGWILDKPLALLFDPFQSVVLYISVTTMSSVVADGKSNWLEGVILICLYVVIAVSFWFYPGSNFSTNLAVCNISPPIDL